MTPIGQVLANRVVKGWGADNVPPVPTAACGTGFPTLRHVPSTFGHVLLSRRRDNALAGCSRLHAD